MMIVETTAHGQEYARTFAEGVALYNQRLAETGNTGLVALSVRTAQGDDVLVLHTPSLDWQHPSLPMIQAVLGVTI